MTDVLSDLRRLCRIGTRKLRTVLEGPPSHPDFIRAAHYFSDGWALNMWQVMDPRKISGELRAIQQDGFNTIILVIPWRGFQVDQLQPVYDSFHERQLNRVMAAADKLGLSVIARVAYTFQVSMENNLNGISQAQRLLTDEDTRRAWLDYLAYIYKICHSYRCFRQGFLSWEEFWHAFGNWQRRNPRPRRELASVTGYLDYLQECGIEGVTEIPRADDPHHASFHAFTNHRIREIYELACSVFPGLSMEFRVDKERIQTGDNIEWVRNDDFSDHSGLRFSYWAPFMGAENVGEQLDAERAAHLFEHMLDEVSNHGRHPGHVVDQFNFVDETQKFKGIHAEIREDQVADFLQLSVPLLRQKARGYGIWAYRDYRQNILFNARFLMGMKGWQVPRGHRRLLRRGGLRLGSGAVLRQHLSPMVAGLQRLMSFKKLTLQIALHKVPSRAGLQVRINAGPWRPLELDSGNKQYMLEIPVDFGGIIADGLILELKNEGPALDVYSLWLYHWIFRGAIRREDATPSRHYEALVAFNESLEQYQLTDERDQTD
jgi:hypothetical protein